MSKSTEKRLGHQLHGNRIRASVETLEDQQYVCFVPTKGPRTTVRTTVDAFPPETLQQLVTFAVQQRLLSMSAHIDDPAERMSHILDHYERLIKGGPF